MIKALLLLVAGPVVAQSAQVVPARPVSATTSIGTDATAQTVAAGSVAASLPTPTTSTASAGCCLVPNGTVVEIEIAEPISSQRRKRGEKFALRLAAPLLVDGKTVLPAGVTGVGEIVHAASSGGGGKPGELLLAARYLEVDDRQIPLRGFRMGATGKDTSRTALAVSTAIGPFAQFIHGREIEIPAGTRANAKFAADTSLPPTNATTTQQE